jgi:hypothetical protein
MFREAQKVGHSKFVEGVKPVIQPIRAKNIYKSSAGNIGHRVTLQNYMAT